MGRVTYEQLDTSILAESRVLLDSSVVIAYINGQELFSPSAIRVFDEFVLQARNPAVISAVTVMEVLIRPMRSGPPGSYVHTMHFLQQFPNLSILPFDAVVAQEAASLRAHFGLSLPDAITVGTAIVAQVRYAITADQGWAKKLDKVKNRVEVICIT